MCNQEEEIIKLGYDMQKLENTNWKIHNGSKEGIKDTQKVQYVLGKSKESYNHCNQ